MSKYSRIALINDLSGMGRCSLTASIAVLSVMGASPCPLPTALLSHQTAFKNHYSRDLTADIPELALRWELLGERFDGIFTGYVANSEQLELISRFINTFRAANQLVMTDPVLGDDGALYPSCDDATVRGMRRLVANADLITPNLTELCLLTGNDYVKLTEHIAEHKNTRGVFSTAMGLINHQRQKIVVTGIPVGDSLHTVYISNDGSGEIVCERLGGSYSGTGDIFSSIVGGCLINGMALRDAVQTATDFISEAIRRTPRSADPRYGVSFEGLLYKLGERIDKND